MRLVHGSCHIIAIDAVLSLSLRLDYEFLFKLTLVSGKASAFYGLISEVRRSLTCLIFYYDHRRLGNNSRGFFIFLNNFAIGGDWLNLGFANMRLNCLNVIFSFLNSAFSSFVSTVEQLLVEYEKFLPVQNSILVKISLHKVFRELLLYVIAELLHYRDAKLLHQ